MHRAVVLLLFACGPSPEWVAVAPPRSGPCFEARTYACLGAVRVQPHLLAALPYVDGSNGVGTIEQVARLNVQAAIPVLRAMLGPDRDERVRVASAAALADLDDRASAPPIATLLRQLEEGTYPASWDHTAETLRRLDLEVAHAYARDWMARHPGLPSASEQARARWVLQVVRAREDASALPLLVAWTRPFERARGPSVDLLVADLLAARIALREQPLRASFQRALGTRDATVPVHPELVLAGLGDEAADAPGLARFASSTSPEARVAYDGIDRLAARLDARARAALVARMSEYTHVREDPSHPNYDTELLARHHASLVRLGHAPSRARLAELCRADGTAGSYVAARHALELEIEGAREHAYEVLASARAGSEVPAERRLELLDVAVSRLGAADGRWAVALLDPHLDVHQRAVFHLARLRPPSACDAVFPAIAAVALERVVRPALVPLTLLGDACRPHLEQLVEHPRAPASVRAPALEVLAMVRAPSALALADRHAHERGMRRAAEVAYDVATAPD